MTPTINDIEARQIALDAAHALREAIGVASYDTFKVDGAVALSRYLATTFRAELDAAERAIADALPPLTGAEFVKACNGDGAVSGEVTRWRDARWSMADVSELRGMGGTSDEQDGDVWTILRGSRRFEVREVPRYSVKHHGNGDDMFYVHDAETNDMATGAAPSPDSEDCDFGTLADARAEAERMNVEQDPVYVVWDTDADADAREGRNGIDDYDPTDESSADDAAAAANVEDYRSNAAGWPFAQNYAAAIDERNADDFAACGFVVATHEPSGQVYAGIDGGGYSFLDAHWAPLYLRFMLPDILPERRTIYVPTRDGLRRVVRAAE